MEMNITEGKNKPAVFRMNRKAMYVKSGAMERTVVRKMATPELRETLSCFGSRVCAFTLDRHGKELKRTPAGKLPATFSQHGLIDNARVFHPPFYRDRKSWSVKQRLPMGSGRYGKGKLTYRVLRTTTDGRLAAVQVTGTLAAEDFTGAQQLKIRNVVYEVSGTQTFNLKRNCWVSGSLDVKVSFDTYQDETKAASATSTMTLTLEEEKGKDKR
jgi:hypothetical protein